MLFINKLHSIFKLYRLYNWYKSLVYHLHGIMTPPCGEYSRHRRALGETKADIGTKHNYKTIKGQNKRSNISYNSPPAKNVIKCHIRINNY